MFPETGGTAQQDDLVNISLSPRAIVTKSSFKKGKKDSSVSPPKVAPLGQFKAVNPDRKHLLSPVLE